MDSGIRAGNCSFFMRKIRLLSTFSKKFHFSLDIMHYIGYNVDKKKKGEINMKIYGILVRYPNGDKNINEAFTTKEKAKAKILEKIAKKDIVTYENDYMYGDLERMITYIIKEMEVD